MTGIVSRFPASWRTDVVVIRGGGRDDWGNPSTVVEIPLGGCLIGPRATSEPADRGDLTSSTAVLYRDPDPTFTFLPTDRIRNPAGFVWSVDGEPQVWPLGVEVPLKRGV